MFRILVTGSRDWDDKSAISSALIWQVESKGLNFSDIVVIHGAARGADSLAREIALDYGMSEDAYPADWSLGRFAGPLRNQYMVDAGADAAMAFYQAGSRGTKDCIKRIMAAGIPLVIYPYNFDNGQSVAEVDELFGESDG